MLKQRKIFLKALSTPIQISVKSEGRKFNFHVKQAVSMKDLLKSSGVIYWKTMNTTFDVTTFEHLVCSNHATAHLLSVGLHSSSHPAILVPPGCEQTVLQAWGAVPSMQSTFSFTRKVHENQQGLYLDVANRLLMSADDINL
jgi:hypothetical protein